MKTFQEFINIHEAIEVLQDIVDDNKPQKYEFEDGSSLNVDVQTASLLLIVYEGLGNAEKKKFEEKVYKSKKDFLQLVKTSQEKVD